LVDGEEPVLRWVPDALSVAWFEFQQPVDVIWRNDKFWRPSEPTLRQRVAGCGVHDVVVADGRGLQPEVSADQYVLTATAAGGRHDWTGLHC